MSASPSEAAAPETHRLLVAVRKFATAPIVLYQRFVSPAIPRRCKYEPTCSRYALDAVREYGILKGLVLAGWRLLRCNPLSYGGYDPVQAQRVFKGGPASSKGQPVGDDPSARAAGSAPSSSKLPPKPAENS